MSEDHRDRTRARKPLVIVVAAALVTLASLFSAASAPASVRGIDGIADARYCELFEMTGALPDAKVVVWNTIGLNDCPERKWEAIDTAALAEERGSTLIIKNGPRHFLMDAASAKTGRVDTLGGIEMRKVATIPVSSPADLDRSPYTERTIGRTNDWKWKKGRKVFELLAPNGSDYLMQSYSQEIDPSQSIDDLDKLGKKLDLPQGWEYRVRKLNKPLVLEAKGEATILQDDLRNTYQRLPAKQGKKHEEARARPDREDQAAGLRARRLADRPPARSPASRSAPGRSRSSSRSTRDSTATGTFTIDADAGEVFGTAALTYVIADGEIHFTGTSTLTGGTGKYRGIKGKNLPTTDDNTFPDGQNGRISVTGKVKY